MAIELKSKLHTEDYYYQVLNVRPRNKNTFVLSLSKCRFKFVAGQHINLSIIGEHISREYSIYSAEESQNLEILVKRGTRRFFFSKNKVFCN